LLRHTALTKPMNTVLIGFVGGKEDDYSSSSNNNRSIAPGVRGMQLRQIIVCLTIVK